jgi:hypothetical protein
MLATLGMGIKAVEFAQKNAKPLLGVSAVAFALLWSRSCIQSNALSIELEACKAKPPAVQTVTVAAKAKQVVQIVYRDGSPCPDVTATNDNDFNVGVTQTASGDKTSPVGMGPLTLGLGAAYYYGIWHPAAGVGVAFGKVGGYEVGAAVDVAAAAFDGTPGLEPMGMVKMTVRR